MREDGDGGGLGRAANNRLEYDNARSGSNGAPATLLFGISRKLSSSCRKQFFFVAYFAVDPVISMD